MPPDARFCPQCAAPAETRELDGKPRRCCPTCGTPIFQNPPPLAAAVVLNDRREILLVKCKRWHDQATWCLPMSFAESSESIEAAAERGLRESTGVEGRPIRLLETGSTSSEEYGDLLIVTFEMKKVGGTESPGPRAEAVAYFPLSRIPKLGFEANEKAVRTCADTHLEEWAIRDSFDRLQADDVKVMLSDALLGVIKDHADDIARTWVDDVRENASTPAYKTVDQEALFEVASNVLSQFGRWLCGDEADREVSEYYFQIGRERRTQGFTAHEVLSAFTLLKKHLWTFARNHGIWERPIDVYRVLELNRRIAVFFDKAVYHAARGFEAE
jgi:8-oxo-dGTP diphosphatase